MIDFNITICPTSPNYKALVEIMTMMKVSQPKLFFNIVNSQLTQDKEGAE